MLPITGSVSKGLSICSMYLPSYMLVYILQSLANKVPLERQCINKLSYNKYDSLILAKLVPTHTYVSRIIEHVENGDFVRTYMCSVLNKMRT